MHKKLYLRACLLLSVLLFSGCNFSYYPASHNASQIQINSSIPLSADENSVSHILEPYKSELADKMSVVLTRSDQALQKAKPESALGNLMADALKAECSKHYGEPIDFASINYGGIRSVLPEGEITVGAIYELMPFDNELVVLQISGSTALELFEHWARSGGIPVAGANFIIDENRNLLSAYIDGQELDTERSYLVGLTDYVANGGDGCDMLSDPLERFNLNIRYRDAIIDYLRRLEAEGNRINTGIESRVVIKHE